MSTVQETPQAAPNEFSSEKVTDNAILKKDVALETKPEEIAAVETKTEGKESEAKVDEAKVETSAEDGKSTAEIKLSLKDGSGLTEKDANDIKLFAEANGLTQDAAQKLLDAKANTIADVRSQDQQNLKVQAGIWLEQTKNDKEIGGEQFQAAVNHGKTVLDQFATPNFRKTLNDTGLGNHPEVVRLFARIGKKMANDSFVAAPKGEAAQTEKQPYEYLYGADKQT